MKKMMKKKSHEITGRWNRRVWFMRILQLAGMYFIHGDSAKQKPGVRLMIVGG